MSTVKSRRTAGLFLAAAIFAVDQLVKWTVAHPLMLRERGTIEIVPFFRLAWTENNGISLGLLSAETETGRWLLVAMTGLVAAVVLVWLLKERLMPEIAALGAVLGGALGNIVDRIQHGYVVDYADLHFGEFRPFMVFNLADAAISLGVVFILARSLLSRDKPAKPDTPVTENGAAAPSPESQ
ncbi:signal peptidase II [Parablastomonas sp. CN1-191]|uniref:signal peptidase II n=1 Tax=Parablastomonas sp. CN1-191 TaxID=3400908 RepID=UPI003BF8C413